VNLSGVSCQSILNGYQNLTLVFFLVLAFLGGPGQAGPPMISHRRGGHVKLTGTNTFAVPRTVARPLGWGTPHGDSSTTSIGDQAPKSNSEFRNMFLEKK
jgi:hypothetical protein